MLYLAILLKDQVTSLERVNKAAIIRKQRKKKADLEARYVNKGRGRGAYCLKER